MPGAHVVIKTAGRPEEVPQEVLEQAARLAAYYSKGRDSTKVPVMFTKVKYLRKPKGAKPGLVLVRREEGTLLVPPEAEEARCSS
jgi:predicted ribosome quality control (RQC) complex YloA/Tae2 family protein